MCDLLREKRPIAAKRRFETQLTGCFVFSSVCDSC